MGLVQADCFRATDPSRAHLDSAAGPSSGIGVARSRPRRVAEAGFYLQKVIEVLRRQ